MPAMIATWLLGSRWLAWSGGWLAAPWFHAKLALVLALSGLHGLFGRMGQAISPPTATGTAKNSIVLSMRYRRF